MTPEKIDIEITTTALMGFEMYLIKYPHEFTSLKIISVVLKLCTSNRHLFKKLKLYNSLKNIFE